MACDVSDCDIRKSSSTNKLAREIIDIEFEEIIKQFFSIATWHRLRLCGGNYNVYLN